MFFSKLFDSRFGGVKPLFLFISLKSHGPSPENTSPGRSTDRLIFECQSDGTYIFEDVVSGVDFSRRWSWRWRGCVVEGWGTTDSSLWFSVLRTSPRSRGRLRKFGLYWVRWPIRREVGGASCITT